MHTPLTITAGDGVTRASVVPTLGFTCIEFCTEVAGVRASVLDTESGFLSGQSRAGRSGIPILFPFPNRIHSGRFPFQGATYTVPPPDWFPQTIHGFCLDRPWRVLESADDRVTGEFLLSRDAPDRHRQWPADARLTVTYRVSPEVLRAEIVVENPDTVPLPWGFGTHPYFRLPPTGSGTPESCTIHADAERVWELEQCFPTGSHAAVPPQKDLRQGWRYGQTFLDDVYTSLSPVEGTIVQSISDSASGLMVTQRSCDDFRELVVFTPQDRPVICLEPYTCTTDAANLQARGLDAGWRELAPGDQAKLWFEIKVSPLG